MIEGHNYRPELNRQAIERGLVFIELKDEVSDRLELPSLIPIFKQDLEQELSGGQISPAAIAAGIEALKLLNSSLDEYDRFLARYYLLEAQRALEQKDTYQAQRYFQKGYALDQDELSAEAAFYLAGLMAPADPEGAIRFYRESLRLNPNSAAAHFELGLLMRDRRDLQASLTEFEVAYRLEPNSANLLNEVGDTHVMAEDLPSARAAYKRASELEPDYWILSVKLGITEYNMADFPAAIKDLRNGLELAPEELDTDFTASLYLEGLYYLGLAYRESGKPEQARKIFRAVLNITPDHPGALEGLNR
ncbi:MAG: tetratricopeptide repeat protein [Chloroflexota bacterium]